MKRLSPPSLAWIPASSLPPALDGARIDPDQYVPMIIGNGERGRSFTLDPLRFIAGFLLGYRDRPPAPVDHDEFRARCAGAIAFVAAQCGVAPQQIASDSAALIRQSHGYAAGFQVLGAARELYPQDDKIAHDLLLDAWNVLCFCPANDSTEIVALLISLTSDAAIGRTLPPNRPIFQFARIYALAGAGRRDEALATCEGWHSSGALTSERRARLEAIVSTQPPPGEQLSSVFSEFMSVE